MIRPMRRNNHTPNARLSLRGLAESIRKRGLPLEIMRSYDNYINMYDLGTTLNEKDGMKRLVKRYELLYQIADAFAEDVLLKYFDSEIVEDALSLAASGFIKWSEIVWFCESRSIKCIKMFEDGTK